MWYKSKIRSKYTHNEYNNYESVLNYFSRRFDIKIHFNSLSYNRYFNPKVSDSCFIVFNLIRFSTMIFEYCFSNRLASFLLILCLYIRK